ncbi:hypothetical protein AX14_011242, partial [Amanita brunnescens Koide BX004]
MPTIANMMPATARMPLRASQEAPRFSGAANDLSIYLATVEVLCREHQRSSEAELIKYAVYYADESSWDSLTLARDSLDDPTSWGEFKQTVHGFYPQHEDSPIVVSQQASPPTPAVASKLSAFALPPTNIPLPVALLPLAAPTTESPAPTVTLSPDAIEVLLSFAQPMPPDMSALQQPLMAPALFRPSTIHVPALQPAV